MKLLSCGKVNLKIYIYIIIYALIELSFSLLNLYFQNNENDEINNVFINKIISFGFGVIIGIPALVLKNIKSKNKNIENKSKSKITYIFYNPYKQLSSRKLLFSILLIIIYYIYSIACDLFSKSHMELLKYGSNEYYGSMDIFYLYLIFKFKHKIVFYKHQYLSLIIIILMELIRYFFELFLFKGVSLNFKSDDLFSLIPLVIFPVFDTLENYFLKYFMEYYYYSPVFICFLRGIVYAVISIIMVAIFLNINCTGFIWDFCLFLSENKSISTKAIIIYVVQSILHLSCTFFKLLIMDKFTIFHIIILYTINTLIISCVNLIENNTIYEIIMIIITFLIEILSVFIFLEIIELNFCGLNHDLRKNIISRAMDDNNLIYEINDEDDDNSENELPNDKDKDKIIDDNDSEY